MRDLVAIRFAKSRISRKHHARRGARATSDAIRTQRQIESHHAKGFLQIWRLVIRDGRDVADAETPRRLLHPLRSFGSACAIERERRMYDVFDRPNALS